jgi:N-acetylglucosaminyl-diphospho-decaprenol L-rhamnosyltransferase
MIARDHVPAPDAGRRGGGGFGSEHVDCVIVGVTYNNADHIEAFLDSIPLATSGLSIRCLIVDNDSHDGTGELLRARRDVVVIESGANLGYSGAINVARAAAGSCSSLLIVNPDLVLEEGAVSALYAAVCEPGIGVTVPMLLEDDGRLYLSLRREPTVLRSLGDAVLGARVPGRPASLSETVRDPRAYERALDIDWASGAALMISSACNRAVGEWDSGRFFLYAEETDLATRVRRCGYRIRYVPDARVRHESGGSGRSPALAALLAVNRVRFFEKYHGAPARHMYRATIALQHLFRCCRASDRAALSAVCRRSSWSELPRAGPGPCPG